MIDVGFVPVAARTARPSLFGTTLVQESGFHRLGQAAPDPAARARSAIARFDAAVARTGYVANDTERDAIRSWVGSAADAGSPAGRRAAIEEEAGKGTISPQLLTGFETTVSELEAKVKNAEDVYGKLSQPVPERKATEWAMPVAIVGAAAIAAAVWFLWGK